MVLSKYLELHSEDVNQRKVIELGAGIGLPSLVAFQLGASRVVSTDDAARIPLLEANIALNFTSSGICAEPLRWGQEHAMGIHANEFDVVLCSDVLFSGGRRLLVLACCICCQSCFRCTLAARYFVRR